MNYIALAPMDGITNNAYRMLCKQIWDNNQNSLNNNFQLLRFTEFMTADGFIRNPSNVSRHLLTTQGSEQTIAQIYGGNHDTLLETAQKVDSDYQESFIGVELNIGCPSPRIMSCEAGSGMLRCRPKTMEIIKQISQSIHKPFSIKTRAGLTNEDKNEQFDFIIESAYHCRMITIHGRTYKQSHSGDVDRSFIYRVKQELIRRNLGDVVILGNGGIDDATSGLIHIQDGGIDGIMLGQSAMCSPWALTNYLPTHRELLDTIYSHLHLMLANEIYFDYTPGVFNKLTNRLTQPSKNQLDDIIDNLTYHIDNIQDGGAKLHSIIEFRKHLFWYVHGLKGNKEFKQSIVPITDYYELTSHINTYFNGL
ncbi:MAG TPA: tRNA-dihydrouridine synthase [Candidatus Absconditabacterales bacterium]|nr:tRNA-dihydrouridine synthase [Candidatus Absconditabacterales bacterium]HNG97124.1 tRNA-dihydrouridine synthase [Candidatus Absconditabacterales bacterium]